MVLASWTRLAVLGRGFLRSGLAPPEGGLLPSLGWCHVNAPWARTATDSDEEIREASPGWISTMLTVAKGANLFSTGMISFLGDSGLAGGSTTTRRPPGPTVIWYLEKSLFVKLAVDSITRRTSARGYGRLLAREEEKEGLHRDLPILDVSGAREFLRIQTFLVECFLRDSRGCRGTLACPRLATSKLSRSKTSALAGL